MSLQKIEISIQFKIKCHSSDNPRNFKATLTSTSAHTVTTNHLIFVKFSINLQRLNVILETLLTEASIACSAPVLVSIIEVVRMHISLKASVICRKLRLVEDAMVHVRVSLKRRLRSLLSWNIIAFEELLTGK